MTSRKATRGLAVMAIALTGLVLFRWLSPGAAQQIASPGQTVAMDPAAIGLYVELGIGDKEAATWEGQIRVSPGTVERIDLWEARPGWRAEDSRFTAPAPQQRPAAVSVQLFATLTAPPGAEVVLETNHGTASFSLADTTAEKPLALLDGRARVRRTPPSFLVTKPGRDDDFPAAAPAPDGSLWLVYASYQNGQPLDEEAIQKRQFESLVPQSNGDSIFLIHYDGRQWSAPLEVTEGLSDVWRPTVAVDGEGNIWVTWSEQRSGNWDLYQRRWDPERNQWSAVERLTREVGADVNVVSVGDSKGQLWWTWQAWRGDNFNILMASSEGSAERPTVVAGSAANEWNPAIAADSGGNVYVGWDSYAAGNYDVLVRRFGGRPSETFPVADTAYFEARPSLACDSNDRLWIAYEEDEPNWGKDYSSRDANRPVRNRGSSLYLNRRVRVKALSGDRLLVPAGDLAGAYGGLLNRQKSFPRLTADASGNIWLLFRHHARTGRGGEVWAGSVTHYDGRQWSPAQLLPASDYILDNRPALTRWKGEAIVAVYASDARLRVSEGDRENNLFATAFSAPTASKPQLTADTAAGPKVELVHPREEEDIARLRAYRVEVAGKNYRLLRGEFHRHTEFTSHRDQDGGFEDMWRYGLDAAAMDWIGNGDHDNGRGREYVWWIVQKVTDIFHHPPHFVPPFTYERSVVYPNGHRNVMFSRRGIRPLPRGPLPGTPDEGTPDTKLLYAYLHRFRGICAIHTSGTNMGTDWRDNDPEVEPVVEIYQGRRHNYEHYGAPRSATPETQIGGFQPAGFIWNAWARGYRLGIQSSSDHMSTHISYAVALAEEASREAIVDAFRKRHCYGATDNIVLDVRAGEHLMGDEFRSQGPVQLEVKAIGTQPIRRVFIVKNNGYVYEAGPSGSEIEFTWQDLRQASGTLSYYYVRLEQEDGQLAWSSPIWVRYQ